MEPTKSGHRDNLAPARRCRCYKTPFGRVLPQTEMGSVLVVIAEVIFHHSRRAYLAFIDESGFMLTPSLCRTYAPSGHAPVVKVTDPHGRISPIGAITLSPECQQVNLTFQLSADNAN